MKPDIQKIIKNIKDSKKTDISQKLTASLVHPQFWGKDMRKEAMDMGAYGAKEMWGDQPGDQSNAGS